MKKLRIAAAAVCYMVLSAGPARLDGPNALTAARGQIPTPAPGVKSVHVLSLQSATQAQRCSNSSLMAQVFADANSVRAYFAENSYGLASITGTVSGPYTITMGSTCDITGWADQADSAATAAGLNVSVYDTKVYVLPPESTALRCSPGTHRRNRIWIRDDTCDNKFNITHELGHAFGSGHASISETYMSPPVPDARQSIARQLVYGDLSSVMGGTLDGLVDAETERAMFNVAPHFNAPQKIHMGWLPASNI